MKPTWEASVERARLAGLKSFAGRMEAAAASFEQVPPNGAGAGEGRLEQFAAAADITYASLDYYRQVWRWMGMDFRYLSEIRSYSIAREAMAARLDEWSTAADFVAFMERTDPPVGFRRWTVDAVRAYRGRATTHTGAAQQARAARAADPDSRPIPQGPMIDWERVHDREVDERRERMDNPAGSRACDAGMHLVTAIRYLKRAADELHGAPLAEPFRDVMERDARRARGLLDLITIALNGESDVDWDAEFANLSEG